MSSPISTGCVLSYLPFRHSLATVTSSPEHQTLTPSRVFMREISCTSCYFCSNQRLYIYRHLPEWFKMGSAARGGLPERQRRARERPDRPVRRASGPSP